LNQYIFQIKCKKKKCVELSFTSVPGSTVGLNVFEYDAVLHGLSNEIIKERLLKYLTTYEQVPTLNMQATPSMIPHSDMSRHAAEKVPRTISKEDEEKQMNHKRIVFNLNYFIIVRSFVYTC
jgi:hypothetical protein